MAANIGLPYEITLASTKSHSDLCRLRKDDAVYRKIEDRISGSAKGMSSTPIPNDLQHSQVLQSPFVRRSDFRIGGRT